MSDLSTRITDEQVERAWAKLLEADCLPYGASVKDFSDEELRQGALKRADADAERRNRGFVREVLEAAAGADERHVS